VDAPTRFDPQHRRREPRLWLCSICSGLAPRATRVTYELGLSSVPPHLRCDSCLEELRADEALSHAGMVASTAEYVWAVRELGVLEAPTRRDAHEGTGTQATLRATAAGGIEL